MAEHRQLAVYRPPTDEIVSAYLERWLADAVQGRRRASTVDRYRLAVR